jgi:hypothetical protein
MDPGTSVGTPMGILGTNGGRLSGSEHDGRSQTPVTTPAAREAHPPRTPPAPDTLRQGAGRTRLAEDIEGRAGYSWRTAMRGSTVVARRAGSRQAIVATTTRTVTARANVHGSVAVTP